MLFAAARDDHVRCTDRAGARTPANGWSATASPIRPASIRARSARSIARLIRGLERVTVGDLKPDLTFILDVPAEVGLARAPSAAATPRADRFEGGERRVPRKAARGLPRARRRRAGALRPDRCQRAARQQVAKQIWDIVQARLDPATAPLDARGRRPVVSARMSRRATTTRSAASAHDRRVLFGHAEAEQALLAAYRSGRMPHAWLIGGPPGIGKATLAYRMARFVLAHPDPAAPDGADGDIARGRSGPSGGAPDRRRRRQPDLLVLERTLNDKGKLRTADPRRRRAPHRGVLRLDRGRGRLARRHRRRGRRPEQAGRQRAAQGAGGAAAARAVPAGQPRAAARVLPTIRSRCRLLTLRPLAPTDVARAVAAALGARLPDDAEVVAAARRGRRQRRARARAARRRRAGAAPAASLDLLDRLPDARSARAARARRSASPAPTRSRSPPSSTPSTPGCRRASTRRAGEIGRLARLAEAWEQRQRAPRATPRPTISTASRWCFSVFGLLAEAARG